MDKLVKGTARGGELLVAAVVDTALVEKARLIHGTYPTATAAFGRALSGALLLSSTLKADQRIILQVRGDGPLGEIVAEADSSSRVRGYVKNPRTQLDARDGKLDVGAAVGMGTLNVVKDLGLKEPYRGTVDLQTGEIGDDLAYYLNTSEQIPAVVALGVFVEADNSVKASGGFMVQVMPGAGDDTIDYLEERVKKIRGVSSMIMDGLGPAEMLDSALGLPVSIHETREVEYHCQCNRDRVLDALAALARSDIDDLTGRGEPLEISCRFCEAVFVVTPEELTELTRSAGGAAAGPAGKEPEDRD